jgi:hypothetical protein
MIGRTSHEAARTGRDLLLVLTWCFSLTLLERRTKLLADFDILLTMREPLLFPKP